MDRDSTFGRLFGVDLRSLALFRVGLGALVLADLWIRSGDLARHYTDAGWLPLAALRDVPDPAWTWSPYHLSGSYAWAAALFGLNALLGLGLLVGYRTRGCNLGCWLLMLSLQERNPLVLDGADMMFRNLLFWGNFLPLGARFSLDARRDPALARAPVRVAGWASLALLMQPVMLYEFAAMTKVQPEWIVEGTGLYYALMLDQLVKPLGLWLLGFPRLLWVMNWGTLVWEYLGPLLFFSPWRTAQVRLLAMATFVALQAGFGQCIRLMLFPWVSTLSLVPLLPPEFWGWLGRHVPACREVGPKQGPGVGPGAGVHRLAAALLVYTFLWNVQTLPEPLFRFPAWARRPGLLLRLEQWWYLFAPPWKTDGWYVLEATMADGRTLDLRTGAPVDFGKPASTYEAFPSHRTWAFYRFLGYPSSRALRGHFLRALRAEFPRRRQLVEVRMIYVMERTLPGFRVAPLERVLLYHEFRALGGAAAIQRPRLEIEDVPEVPGAR